MLSALPLTLGLVLTLPAALAASPPNVAPPPPASGSQSASAGASEDVSAGASAAHAAELTVDAIAPVSIHGTPVSLEELLVHAKEHAPAVVVTAASRARAEAARTSAKPLFRSDPVAFAAVGTRTMTGQASSLEAQVQLQQPVEIGFERRARLQAAKRLEQTVEQDVLRAQWTVETAIRQAYRAALVARDRATAAQQSLMFAQRTLQFVELQRTSGELSELQVQVARLQVADARQSAIELEYRYRATCLALAAEAGWQSAIPPEPNGALPVPVRVKPEGLLDEAQDNPRLALLQRRLDHANAELKVQKRDSVPDVWLGMYYGRERDPITRDPMNVWMGSVQMNLPFWQLNRSGRAQAKADVRQAQADVDAYLATLSPKVGAAAAAVNAAADRTAVYGANALPLLRSGLQLTERAFELGEIDILAVAVARDRFVQLQRVALDAYDDYFGRLAELELLLGVEITPSSPLAAPTSTATISTLSAGAPTP